jgi:hypothetical protein
MEKPSITIIVLDTLRLDTFNSLSGQKGRELSRLGDFVTLQGCIAPSSWTLPSHASLFTGLYPSEHGAHETKTVKALDIAKISLKKRTFVSDLKSMRYKTYAISANPYVHPVYGFDEFDSFTEESYFTDIWGSVVEIADRLKPKVAKYRNEYGSDLLKLSSAMLKEDPNLFFETALSGLALTPIAAVKKMKARLIDGWPIEKGGRNTVARVRRMSMKRPFFLFVNLMEAHDPYTVSKKKAMSWVTPFLKEKTSEATLSLWEKLYWKAAQRGYAYAYSIIEDVIERFGDNQIVILTSDHGQEFGEHGFIGHGTVLDDEVVRVPMAVLLPKGFGRGKRRQYSSLVNVRRFLSAALSGKRDAIAELYSKEVRAESFGVPAAISRIAGIDVRKLRAHEKATKRRFRS